MRIMAEETVLTITPRVSLGDLELGIGCLRM